MKSATPLIAPAQCRAARALLQWSREELSEASNVALRTIIDFEREARSARGSTIEALTQALEAAGVEFTNGDAPGVRLRRG